MVFLISALRQRISNDICAACYTGLNEWMMQIQIQKIIIQTLNGIN